MKMYLTYPHLTVGKALRGMLLIAMALGLFVNPLARAQDVPSKLDDAELKAFQEKYEKASHVIYGQRTEYNFDFNAKDAVVTATEDHTIHYVPLRSIQYDIQGGSWLVRKMMRNAKPTALQAEGAIYYDSYSNIYKKKGDIYLGGTSSVDINGIFHHDAMVYYYSVQFEGIAKPATVEISKAYTDTKYLTTVFFQSSRYPVREHTVVFNIPNDIDIEVVPFNLDNYEITKEETPGKKGKVISYTARNLDKLPDEENAPGRSHYAPHLIVLTKSVTTSKGKVNILGSTQDQYDWYRGLLNDTGNERDKLQSTVDRLTANTESPEDRVESIYYWVQDNIRYVAFEQGLAGFQPENCQNVYTNKYGDCKGMANLLTEMLQMAGLDAHMTWIGTNSKVYDYSIPSLAVDNHAITTVFLEGQPHYLDATEKYIAFGDYAERIQGRPVLIEQGEAYKLAEVPKFDHQRNLTRKVFDFEVNGDELHGSIALRYNGESKVRLLSTWHSLLNENKEQAKSYLLMRGDDNVHVEKVETSDFDHRDREMSVTGQVRLRNKVFSFDGETYIDWALYQEYGDFKIDSTRVTDYQFSQKINLEKETRIKIPAGYQVKTLPENMVLDNADFNIKVEVSQADGQVSIRQQVIVPKARIRVEQIEAWNAAVDALNEKVYKRQIILVKA